MELFVAAYPALAGRAVREPDLRSSTARVIVDTISYPSGCAVDRSDVAVLPSCGIQGQRADSCAAKACLMRSGLTSTVGHVGGRPMTASVLGVYVVTAQHVEGTLELAC